VESPAARSAAAAESSNVWTAASWPKSVHVLPLLSTFVVRFVTTPRDSGIEYLIVPLARRSSFDCSGSRRMTVSPMAATTWVESL